MKLMLKYMNNLLKYFNYLLLFNNYAIPNPKIDVKTAILIDHDSMKLFMN